jgi:osmotically-inducible protein OsmY
MAAIRNRLAGDLRLAALAIDVCCSEGCVSLAGKVDSAEQKRLAIELIAGMVGVREVSDELNVAQTGV